MEKEIVTHRGFNIEIMLDESPESPREWDNLGTMASWHRRYTLGDEHDFERPDDFMKSLRGKRYVMLPLFIYEHGGITMRTHSFDCRWDSGQVGWIYVTHEKAREEMNWKRVSKKRREKLAEILRKEVSIFDDYLTGNVYGYNIPELEDSCWGFYGKDYMIEEAKAIIDSHLENTKAFKVKWTITLERTLRAESEEKAIEEIEQIDLQHAGSYVENTFKLDEIETLE